MNYVYVIGTIVFALVLCWRTEPRREVWFYSRLNGHFIKFTNTYGNSHNAVVRHFERKGIPYVVVWS